MRGFVGQIWDKELMYFSLSPYTSDKRKEQDSMVYMSLLMSNQYMYIGRQQ